MSFNPLRIGSYCNRMKWSGQKEFAIFVSIPLESGHIVIEIHKLGQQVLVVSIPLESGHIVIYSIFVILYHLLQFQSP